MNKKPSYTMAEMLLLLATTSDKVTFKAICAVWHFDRHLYNSEQKMLIEAHIWGKSHIFRLHDR